MPGTIVFKPIEANLTHNTDLITKMNPYCVFVVGTERYNSQICKKGGKHPVWNDSISVPVGNESRLMVEVMDKDRITKDDTIGSFLIDIQEIESQQHVSKWYPLFYKNKPAGEVLLEADFQGGSFGSNLNQGYNLEQGQMLNQGGLSQTTAMQEENIVLSQPATFQEETIENRASLPEERKIWTEQRQVVEPHTFMKEIDVVETRPVLKEVEVLEGRKVMRDVQVTEAVPVKRQIETIEPKVVMKEVEVIEPRLVTKQIQVIENVPVMKEVEVIESVPVMKEIDTIEPQTFTRQIEVTEQVPVKKQVTVTEPITFKKSVEFVEPIITTKTITKEVQPAVVVDERITQEIGPATVIDQATQSRLYQEGQLNREEGYLNQQSSLNQGNLNQGLNQQGSLNPNLQQSNLGKGNYNYNEQPGYKY